MDNTLHELVIGTAGHIDHGKSSLIKALTGVDPDRLAEEKRRGITIELGFARLTLPDGTSVGVVDVPGHERFVRQMIQGATGIDLALLCIAADDGVMPQTREHVAVLELLGVKDCVVALTKCDLVDNEWIELVSEEIASYLKDTPYAGAPIIPVSARTSTGLGQLSRLLAQHARSAAERTGTGPVRLPIDRVFTIKGAGTVITGTLWSGTVSEGDELEILPGGTPVRVRSVQVHGEPRAQSLAGMRTALNLATISTTDVRPGDLLATPGTLETTDRFDARLSYLPILDGERPLTTGTRARIAHGTREVMGRVLLMDRQEQLDPHATGFVQVRTDTPLPVSRGDRFIVRSLSPAHVIAGGQVLSAHPRRRTTLSPADRALLDALEHDNEAAAIAAVVESAQTPLSAKEIGRAVGIRTADAKELLAESIQKKGSGIRCLDAGIHVYASTALVQKLLATIDSTLLAFHVKHPEATGLSKGALADTLPHHLNPDVFDALLTLAQKSGHAVVLDGEVSHPKAGAGARALEARTAQTLATLLESYADTPPTLPDLFAEAGVDPKQGSKALVTLEREGRAVRITKDWAFDRGALDVLWNAVHTYLEKHDTATATELKNAMRTSRKYAIPLLEHFDALHLTIRSGNDRSLTKKG